MGGQRLIPAIVKFPVPRGLGDILQSWARTNPDKLRALEKLVIWMDAQDKDDIYGRIAAMGKGRR